MSDAPAMKSPEEVRADLNAAREAFRTRHGMYLAWGVTGAPSEMHDYRIAQASSDDTQWEALLDDYIATYTRWLARDQEFRAETDKWRQRYRP